MTYPSAESPEFLATIQSWIEENGEVLSLIRYSAAAGDRSFEFFGSLEAFRARLDACPPRACFTVFHDRQLPLRGRVDDDFVRQALAIVPDGVDFLIVCLEQTTAGKESWFHYSAGDSHAELLEELNDEYCYGKQVAVGSYPPWLKDSDVVISAVVPDEDGNATMGIY